VIITNYLSGGTVNNPGGGSRVPTMPPMPTKWIGILFLTRSVPQQSLSYEITLIGAVLFEFFLFLGYAEWAISGSPGSQYYADFWGYAIFQAWF